MSTSREVADTLSGYPYRELAFDRTGQPVDLAQPPVIRRLGDQPEPVTDLVVLAHGWNNDEAEAADLYRRLAASLAAVQASDAWDGSPLAWRRLGLIGVFWPSKKFADEDLIPGGAAGLGDDDEALRSRIDELRDAFDVPDAERLLTAAAALSTALDDDPRRLAEFVALTRRLLPASAAGASTRDHDAGDLFAGLDAGTAAERLLDPELGDSTSWWGPVPGDAGGAALLTDGPSGTADVGAAAFLGAPLSPRRAARRWLNCTTYFQMKQRAGLVAQTGLAPVLADVIRPGQRLHLIGHSFGARLVTATAAVPICPAVTSISLLQGAFSHYSFAKDWQPGSDGDYRAAIAPGRLLGPMIVTHTRNDHAVGMAYAVASRLARQTASGIGDADSPYGGLGSNGALRTPETIEGELLAAGRAYGLLPGHVHNLLADDYIKDHSDVTGIEVANAVLSAITALTR